MKTLNRMRSVIAEHSRRGPQVALRRAFIAFLMLASGRLATEAEPLHRSGVVINEIMYHVPDDRDDLQYLEFYNSGATLVDLSGWSLKGGVKFQFPAGTKVSPGAYLLLCRDPAAFKSRYGTQIPAMGVFKGKLSHSGENLELVDSASNTVDKVAYRDRAPWPMGPDGFGAALERICPASAGIEPLNWSASAIQSNRQADGTPGAKNSCFSVQPLPEISEVRFDAAEPGKPTPITVRVRTREITPEVALKWIGFPSLVPNWTNTPMRRVSGDDRDGIYAATIPAFPADRIIRFRITARNAAGLERHCPSPTEPRSTFSLSTYVNTNSARIPFLQVLTPRPIRPYGQASQFRGNRSAGSGVPLDTRSGWESAIICQLPGAKEAQLFDHVRVRPRRGGYKISFYKDQLLAELSAIALVNKGPQRWLMSEALSQELYRRAGAMAPQADFVRLYLNRRLMGPYVQLEQPNKAFLRRHGRDDGGNLFKLQWAGNGLIGQHKKMTNPRSGHQDLTKLMAGLRNTSSAAQWDFIQKNFNVEQMINCYAVGMCLQDWDGFFNNYFVYHDLKPGGKWEVYPWDKDKTWGDYDGSSSSYNWYSMPLTFGMNSGRATSDNSLFSFGGGGPFGGNTSWWRPPGWFSGPLLANPEFRQKFLARLREICLTIFTPETLGPVIRGMENRLAPEMATSRIGFGLWQDEFSRNIQSFHNQVEHRRAFILKQLPK